MKTNLYNYFYYTRTERNGALILCLLCIACFVVPPLFRPASRQLESSDFKAQFASYSIAEANAENNNNSNTSTTLFAFNPNTVAKEDLIQLGFTPKLAQTIINYRGKGGHFRRKEDMLKIYGMKQAHYERLEPYIQIGSAENVKWNSNKSYEQKPAVLFSFDPNKSTQTDFVKLGLSEKTAAIILKYRAKGGSFRTKEDLKKIYGLKDKDYERLLPYINIETALPATNQKPTSISIAEAPKSPDFKTYPKKQIVLDINQATAEDWQSLRGIGATYAKRIVNFREKLGGFSSVEQIAETFGLPDSTFQNIKTNLKQSPVLHTIALNTATLDELKAHPYIDSRKAAAIISYREQHGKFRSLDELRQMKALPGVWLDKMQPYFTLD